MANQGRVLTITSALGEKPLKGINLRKLEKMDDTRELEDQLESENEEKNAVSNLLEKFELPDITASNKKDKIPLALDHSQGFILDFTFKVKMF